MDSVTEEILEIFTRINAIPRCSGHEGEIANWLKEWAVSNNLSVKFDAVNNIMISVPGSPGCRKLPAIVIQGHMDMVCEKVPGSDHDFNKDPIRHVVEGDWLKADGTSLGADNGIGLAIGMALAKKRELRHPPLELLFTVDEETGLTGANALTGDFISGNILLNLDSEDEGVFITGCAGGMTTIICFPLSYETVPEDHIFCRLLVHGLAGGHSGVDIHERRANANKVLAKVLHSSISIHDAMILDMKGGSAHNAIPRHAEAIISLPSGEFDPLSSTIEHLKAELLELYSEHDTSISIELDRVENPSKDALDRTVAEKLIDMLLELPHGVAAMSPDIPGLVETSSNLAMINMRRDEMVILSSQRSSISSELEAITERIWSMASSAGARVMNEGGYTAWQPDPSSSLLERCTRVYSDLFSEEAKIEVIHAGLECAVIGSRFPGMAMISFGPTIKNPHSPDERLYIPSIIRVWDLLVAILASYCDEKDVAGKKGSGKANRKRNGKR